MFLRIYAGIASAFIIATLISYIAYQQVNDIRLKHYNQQMMTGVFRLIQSGVARHDGVVRQEWLSIVSRISGLTWQLIKRQSITLNPKEQLKLQNDQLLYRSAKKGNQMELLGPIEGEQLLLKVDVAELEEQQLRAPALLILNELGIVPQQQRITHLQKIKAYFSFDIEIVSKNSLNLDSSQRKRLASGDVVVTWNSDIAGHEKLMVHTNYRDSEKILTLGPIPRFNESPPEVMVSILLICLLFIASASYLFIYQLEKRLAQMMSVIRELGPDNLSQRINIRGRDSIAQLGKTFNDMADRIDSLVTQQHHMLQAVSHDLRTPITRLIFRLDDLDKNIEAVQGIHRDINELNTLVDEILFYYKMDTNHLSHQAAPLKIQLMPAQSYFNELKEKLSAIKESKQLRFANEEGIEIHAYPYYFTRLLQNLAVNAIYYASTQVVISIKQNQDSYELKVEDDGEGIPEQFWHTVFEPFARVDSSRNKTRGGHGLGLAITKRIAIMHEGIITVSSSNLGGACFSFSWPIGGSTS